MFRPEIFGFGKNNVLTMAKIEGDKLTTVERWEPYGDEESEPKRDIESASFLGTNRILTHNRDGDFAHDLGQRVFEGADKYSSASGRRVEDYT